MPQVAPADCRRCNKTGREWYGYWHGCFEFDVEAAKAFVADGHNPVEVEPDSIHDAIRLGKIDEHHLDHVDPQYPGIICFVWLTDDDGVTHRGHLLIDGNHRAARCLRDDRPFFAYLLTEDESRAILLKCPDNTLAAAAT
jgi:hypothetical protein